MKIVIPMFGLGQSGGIKVICRVANELYKRGYDVEIITFRHASDLSLNFNVDVPVKYIYIPKLLLKIPIFNVIIKIILLWRNISKCDIIIANWNLTAYPVHFYRKTRAKKLYYIQAYEPEFFDYDRGVQLHKIIKNKITNKIYKKLAEHSYKLKLYKKIVNNDGINKKINNLFKKEVKFPIIPPGVDLDIFKPNENRKKGKNDQIVIGAITTTTEWKGTRDFFEAMSFTINKGYKIKIKTAFGPYPPKTKYVPHENVEPSTQKELAKFYRSLDIFISPITLIGEFPLGPLEAMACGTPVISTKLDYGINGYNHLEVPQNNPEDISKAVEKLIKNEALRRKLIKNGIETAKKYSWNKIIKLWVEAL